MTGAEAADGSGRQGSAPVLRLIHGATDASEIAVELAALVAVLAARSSEEAAPPPVPSVWAAPAARLRRSINAGPDGWRRSAFPV